MSDTTTSTNALDPASIEWSPDLSPKEKARRMAWLEELEAVRLSILEHRGGKHLTREEIDEALEAVHSGAD